MGEREIYTQLNAEFQRRARRDKKAFFNEQCRNGCLLSPCLFNLNEEHIFPGVKLKELQAGISIGGRNIRNKELKILLMRVKEKSEKASLKLEDHSIQSHHFMAK